MALIGTEKKLADAITKALQNKAGADKATLKVKEASGDSTSDKTYPLSSGEQKPISYSTKPNPKTGAGVNGSGTGADAIAAIIADKIIDHILTNFELAAEKRWNKLETDYNMFLQTLMVGASAAVANPFDAAISAGIIAAVLAGGGPAREAITSATKAQEKAKARGGKLY